MSCEYNLYDNIHRSSILDGRREAFKGRRFKVPPTKPGLPVADEMDELPWLRSIHGFFGTSRMASYPSVSAHASEESGPVVGLGPPL